ncbi:MAG: UDP-N-acetylmuramate--L-alanine ligase [Parachlamydiaceae bacterium]|nr:UDP-N-acetylmuramate--L-alanine ligase [Parachlamydiaceae bacterium]
MGHTQFTENTLGKKYHFIGIGGIGMSALARILLERGAAVSGSDLSMNELAKSLQVLGAKITEGHSEENVPPESIVVYATGVTNENPEFQIATASNFPLLHRSDLLKELAEGYKLLAVAGTHGKTTSSALLTHVLLSSGQDPAFAVGGILPQYGKNGGDGKGECFVIEACESDGTFLKYAPFGAILTNIDADHLDYFGSEKALHEAYFKFIDSVKSKEHLFWCGDDHLLKHHSPPGISYGFGAECVLQISNFYQNEWEITFDLLFRGNLYKHITLPIIGKHNALNASAVFGLALLVGVDEEAIRKAFASFGGIKRRCELKGEHKGILILDDYAHHPVEIKTTLEGIRSAVGEKRIFVVYQPHRYTRTRDCLGMFTSVFDAADEVILTNLYGAGESPIEGITDQKVFEDISRTCKQRVSFVAQDSLINYLSKHLRPHDILVTLGAGNVTFIGNQLLEIFLTEPLAKLRVGVIFGGRSVEHEVSLMSARNIVNALNPDIYTIYYFGISKSGKWIGGLEAKECLENESCVINSHSEQMITSDILHNLQKCDILFPILHGPFGEDGAIQGFFETLGKPYVGCCQRSAAICMDKAVTKELMDLHQVPIVEFLTFSRYNWKNSPDEMIDKIVTKLPFPLFVKPVHLGSSIGIKRANSSKELVQAIQEAFHVDTKIVVEKGVVAREIEFAVLGNEIPHVFPPGEVLANGEIYVYNAKYGPNGISVTAQAELPAGVMDKGTALAKKAYEVAGCKGMARVDFFLDESGKFWLNEINPIPGFTVNSLFPRICHANGVPISKLIDKLITLGLQR